MHIGDEGDSRKRRERGDFGRRGSRAPGEPGEVSAKQRQRLAWDQIAKPFFSGDRSTSERLSGNIWGGMISEGIGREWEGVDSDRADAGLGC